MNQCLIGCCLLMAIMVLKDRGGSVFHATRYSIRQHFALAISVIRSAVIAGSVDVMCTLLLASLALWFIVVMLE
jgi:hypothetical protein